MTPEAAAGGFMDCSSKLRAERNFARQLNRVAPRGQRLFLRTVLGALRQFGSLEQLSQRVPQYLEAGNPKILFLCVLTCRHLDFDGKDPEKDKRKLNLVRRALTLLRAVHQELSKPEWFDLLGDQKTRIRACDLDRRLS